MNEKVMKLVKAAVNSDIRFDLLGNRGFYSSMPDDEYLKRKFRVHMGKELNLESPQTFNEKLQWLKLYNRRPEYTMMVDKYRVRDYIKEQIGEEHLIPLLGVWDDPDEIDFDALPEQFVLKCNHNSGLGMCICKDKTNLNIPKVKSELRKGLKQDYYLTGREWPYKDVPRKIICEKYMTDKSETQGLTDYKFYCFGGKARVVMIASDRYSKQQTRFDYFDREYSHLPIVWGNPYSENPPSKPAQFEQMLGVADQLSAGIPHVRVDLYCVNEQIYFGELTFFDGSGFDAIAPKKWDDTLGGWIELPAENNMRAL